MRKILPSSFQISCRLENSNILASMHTKMLLKVERDYRHAAIDSELKELYKREREKGLSHHGERKKLASSFR